MSDKPKVVSTFTGCGGMDIGLEDVGFETVWANDFSLEATETYANYVGKHIVYGDITEIDPFEDGSILQQTWLLAVFPAKTFQ